MDLLGIENSIWIGLCLRFKLEYHTKKIKRKVHIYHNHFLGHVWNLRILSITLWGSFLKSFFSILYKIKEIKI